MDKFINVSELKKLGLIRLPMSKSQKSNGTHIWLDEQTNNKYGEYKSGYIRRIYTSRCSFSKRTYETMYQLNKKDLTFNPNTVSVVLEPSRQKRIDRISEMVKLHRSKI